MDKASFGFDPERLQVDSEELIEAPAQTNNQGQATDALTLEEQVLFQGALWKLLAKRTALYTMGESSSIPESTAYRLLSSLCFVLGIDMDNLEAATVRHVLADGLEETFDRNLATLGREVKRSDELWEAAARSTPLLESRALKDTLESIRGFSTQYDYRSFADEITCDIDYPLAHAMPDFLQGVSFINEYLRRLTIENEFMQHFDLARCSAVLRAVHPDYRELIINLYEPIATNAIGLAMTGGDVRALGVSEAERGLLANKVRGQSRSAVMRLLKEATDSVCALLQIEDTFSRSYLGEVARALYPRIAAATTDQPRSGVSRSSESGLAGIFLSV